MNVLMLLKPKSEVAYLLDTCTMRQGLEKMRSNRYTAIPVITKDGLYVGTVSEGDFLWHIVGKVGEGGLKTDTMRNCESYSVKQILREDWNPAVTVDVTVDELVRRAAQQNFVPVTDDRGYFIGIVTRKDIITRMVRPETAAGT